MKATTSRCLLPALSLWLFALPAAAEDSRVDELIERLEAQEQEIRTLREEVEDLREGVVHDPKHPEYRREDGQFPVTDYDAPKIRLDIAGQVNQAFTAANDGDKTKAYFVDNDASGSRIRFAAVSTFDETWDLGGTLEVAFSPNNSFDVDQENERAGDLIAVRRGEVWVRDDRFGRLMFGHGSAAADNTAEFDLSMVSGPIMTSGTEFTYGGLLFTNGDDLTQVRVSDAFFNFDGNRMARVRYDTPMFGPAQLSVSAGSDQRYDAALTFGGDYDHWTGIDLPGFTLLGGVGVSRPSDGDEDYRFTSSGSLLHDASGVSLTFSSGFDGGTQDDTPYSLYGKLGWDTRLVRFGPTGFGIDYAWNENLSNEGNEGQTAGVSAVQVFEEYGIEVYGQYRWFGVDGDAPTCTPTPAPGCPTDLSLDDIFLGTLGTRIRF
jgi:hypothetical protein